MAPLLDRIVGWLRRGYPDGVPARDYLPLIALLRRRLTDEEVLLVQRYLRESGALPSDRIDVGVGITHVTGDLPTPEEIDRVQRHLGDPGDLGPVTDEIGG